MPERSEPSTSVGRLMAPPSTRSGRVPVSASRREHQAAVSAALLRGMRVPSPRRGTIRRAIMLVLSMMLCLAMLGALTATGSALVLGGLIASCICFLGWLWELVDGA